MRLVTTLVLASGCAGGGLQQATLNAAGSSKAGPVAPLAIGARFVPEVGTEIAGSTTPNLRLESVAPDIIAVDGDALVAKSPGTAAILITTDDGSVIDFLHVWAAPATSLALATREGERLTGSVGLTVGEDITLVPALFSGAQKLAGSAAATWKVDNEAAVAVLHDGSPDRRRLRARAVGTANITVALGDATTTLTIEVVP